VSSFSSWTTSTRPLGFVFKMNNQSILDRSFQRKGCMCNKLVGIALRKQRHRLHCGV
jgi:hypothetical protein